MKDEIMDEREELIIALAPHYHFPKFPTPPQYRLGFRSRKWEIPPDSTRSWTRNDSFRSEFGFTGHCEGTRRWGRCGERGFGVSGMEGWGFGKFLSLSSLSPPFYLLYLDDDSSVSS
jgi:hypothetical protein